MRAYQSTEADLSILGSDWPQHLRMEIERLNI
jgi:hypothetical protein